MAVKKILAKYYEGLSTDDKPMGVIVGSLFRETDTRAMYVSYDGNNWEVAGKRVRSTNENGSFIDLPGEFDSVVEALEAIGE